MPEPDLNDLSSDLQRLILDGRHDVGRWMANGLGIYLHDKQLEVIEALENNDALYYVLWWANRVGKFLPWDEPVLTPNGWVPIGTIEPGSEVIAGDGTTTVVTGVFPQGIQPVYRLTFDDGAWTRAGGPHLWRVKTPEARFRKPGEPRTNGRGWSGTRLAAGYGDWSVLSTDEIRDRWGSHPAPRSRCAIPVATVEYPDKPIPLEPYALGLILGDGGLTQNAVRFTTIDEELLDPLRRVGEVRHIAGCNYAVKGIVPILRGLGLMGEGSATKFVPTVYLHNSVHVRLAVLQGLMDTDGTVGKGGSAEYATVSPQLASDVADLVRSLGGKASTTSRQTYYTYKGERKAGRRSFRVRVTLPGFQLFRLARKQERVPVLPARRPERLLVSIEPAGDEPSVCISVAHPDGTYVTRDYIVTHNTTVVIPWHLHGIFYKPELGEPKTERDYKLWLASDYRTLHTAPLGALALRLHSSVKEIIDGTHPAQKDPITGERREAPLAAFFSTGTETNANGTPHPVVKSLTGGTVDIYSTEGGGGRIEGTAWRRGSWDEWPQQEGADLQAQIREVHTRLSNRLSDFDGKLLITGTVTEETENIAKDWIAQCEDPQDIDWWGSSATRMDNPHASRRAIAAAERNFDKEDYDRSVLGKIGGVKGRIFTGWMLDPAFTRDLPRETLPHPEDRPTFVPANQPTAMRPRRSADPSAPEEPVRGRYQDSMASPWFYIHAWDLAIAAADNVGLIFRLPRDYLFGVGKPLVGVKRIVIPGSRTLTPQEIDTTIEMTYLLYGGQIVLDTTDAHGKGHARTLKGKGYPVESFTFNERDAVRKVIRKEAAILNTVELLTEGMPLLRGADGQITTDPDGVPMLDGDANDCGAVRVPKEWVRTKDQLSVLKIIDDKQRKDEAMAFLMGCDTAYRLRRGRTRGTTNQRAAWFSGGRRYGGN